MVVAAAMMSAIYEENKDEDGFLYMTYSGENTFGTAWGDQKEKQGVKRCIFSGVSGFHASKDWHSVNVNRNFLSQTYLELVNSSVYAVWIIDHWEYALKWLFAESFEYFDREIITSKHLLF